MATRKNSSIKLESICVEQRLRDFLGANKPLPQHKGKQTDDLWFRIEYKKFGETVIVEFFVEHKDVTAKKIGLNQVHCTRYEVMIVDLTGNEYYDYDYVVLDPAFILSKVLNKKGQHSHSAIECAQVNINPSEVKKYGCKESELFDKIMEAYERGEEKKELKEFALRKAKEIVDRAKQDMQELEKLL